MTIFTVLYSQIKITVPFISAGSTQVQFQPWYLFWTLPFVALVPKIPFMSIALALCVGAIFRYLPFIYFGDWSQPGTIEYMRFVTIVPFAIVTILALFYIKFKKK